MTTSAWHGHLAALTLALSLLPGGALAGSDSPCERRPPRRGSPSLSVTVFGADHQPSAGASVRVEAIADQPTGVFEASGAALGWAGDRHPAFVEGITNAAGEISITHLLHPDDPTCRIPLEIGQPYLVRAVGDATHETRIEVAFDPSGSALSRGAARRAQVRTKLYPAEMSTTGSALRLELWRQTQDMEGSGLQVCEDAAPGANTYRFEGVVRFVEPDDAGRQDRSSPARDVRVTLQQRTEGIPAGCPEGDMDKGCRRFHDPGEAPPPGAEPTLSLTVLTDATGAFTFPWVVREASSPAGGPPQHCTLPLQPGGEYRLTVFRPGYHMVDVWAPAIVEGARGALSLKGEEQVMDLGDIYLIPDEITLTEDGTPVDPTIDLGAGVGISAEGP